VELIHAYSLVHDDLPAMDNDDLRRGKPTCHRAFGEAMAILAGDGLQALAFEVLARHPSMVADPAQRLAMVGILAEAAGAGGMVGGQASDMELSGRQLSLDEIDTIHLHKTGALIRASVRLGALSHPRADDTLLEALDDYAKYVGLAFQIRDDILDSMGEGTAPNGAALHTRGGQPTYMAVLNIEASELRARALHQRALASIARLDERADVLRWLSTFTIERQQ
jgi:farnesyl diphosphate synthase